MRVQPPSGETVWQKGVIQSADNPGRSYHVKTEKGVYRRNRVHLSATVEPPPIFQQVSDNTTAQRKDTFQPSANLQQKLKQKELPPSPKLSVSNDESVTKMATVKSPVKQEITVRRSGRNIKPPARFNEFVKSDVF